MKLEIPSNCQVADLEKIYNDVFFDKDPSYKGVFVEVGAYDGFSHSNTYCLSKAGWSGVYVEPIPHFANACAKNHSFNTNVKVVNAAIASDKDHVDMFVANTLTTSSEEQFKAYLEIDWAKNDIQKFFQGRLRVPCIRLDDLLKKTGISSIDVLVIDTEGTELDVIRSFDLGTIAPKLVICEIEDDHRDFQKTPHIVKRCKETREIFLQSKYEQIYKDEINTVFLKEHV